MKTQLEMTIMGGYSKFGATGSPHHGSVGFPGA